MNKNKLGKLIFNSVGLLTLATGLLANVGTTYASSILDDPDVSVPKAGEEVDGKYSTIAKFTKGVTKAVPIGDSSVKWYNAKTVNPGTSDYGAMWNTISLPDVPDSQKGKIGEMYENVGTYNGKPIDLAIVLTDWKVNTKDTPDGHVSFSEDGIAINSRALAIQTKWIYVDHETQKKIDGVNGFYTFNDLDVKQNIGFSKGFSDHIDHIYVPTDKSGITHNKGSNGSVFIGTPNGTDPDDETSMFTLLYSGADDMDVFWSGPAGADNFGKMKTDSKIDFSQKVDNPEAVNESDAFPIGGDYIGYIAKKPLATATIPPVKTVSDSDESDVNHNTLNDINEEFTYNITHQVPDEWQDFYYKSYSMSDDLDKALDIKKVVVTDDTKKDVTSKFDDHSKDNHIQLDAKADELSKADFYNHTYKFSITVKVKDGADLSGNTDDNGVVTFKNIAKITKDGKEEDSDNVETDIQPKKEDKKLPNTGINKTPDNIIIGLSIVLIGIGSVLYYVGFKKYRNQNDK